MDTQSVDTDKKNPVKWQGMQQYHQYMTYDAQSSPLQTHLRQIRSTVSYWTMNKFQHQVSSYAMSSTYTLVALISSEPGLPVSGNYSLANKDRFTRKLVKPIIRNARFFSVVYEAKGMKFCTQVPRTCVHKHLVLDFHLFA